jgi:hypothetical protein
MCETRSILDSVLSRAGEADFFVIPYLSVPVELRDVFLDVAYFTYLVVHVFHLGVSG